MVITKPGLAPFYISLFSIMVSGCGGGGGSTADGGSGSDAPPPSSPTVHDQTATIDLNHPSIVWKQDFDQYGDISPDLEAQSAFWCVEDCEAGGVGGYTLEEARIEIQAGELKVEQNPGVIGSGFSKQVNLSQSYDELWLTLNVRFDENYDLTMAGGKMFGLGSAVVGREEAQPPTAPSGCVDVGPNEGFSVRWDPTNRGGDVVRRRGLTHYIYDQDKAGNLTGGCGDHYKVYEGGDYSKPFEFRKEQDYVLEMHVRMNDLNEKNGYVETWVNGSMQTRTCCFTFSENGEDGINAFLVAFSNGGKEDQFKLKTLSRAYFDNFALSTQSIVTRN